MSCKIYMEKLLGPLPIKAVFCLFGILKYIRAPGKFVTSYRILE